MAENVANRDEALKCLAISRRALDENDLAKAEKFAKKAKQLYNNSDVDSLLARIEKNKGSGEKNPTPNSDQKGSSGTSSTGPKLPNRQPELRKRQTSQSESSDAGTPEQRQLVQQILKAKDFYEVLCISKTANDDDIKRAYRKLALKLHPDKCRSNNSEEAFKSVSKAFSCLSDADKRAYYDRTGYESTTAAAAAQQGQQAGRRAYAEEVDPEELFNMFFGGGFGPNSRMFRTQFGGVPRRRTAHPGQEGGPRGLAGLLQFVPIIFILLFTFFQNHQQPLYSLHADATFTQQLKTRNMEVEYHVRSKQDFDTKFPPGSSSRGRVERQMESAYGDYLETKCQEDRLKKHRIWTLKGRDAANSYRATWCDKFSAFNERAREVYSQKSPGGGWF